MNDWSDKSIEAIRKKHKGLTSTALEQITSLLNGDLSSAPLTGKALKEVASSLLKAMKSSPTETEKDDDAD